MEYLDEYCVQLKVVSMDANTFPFIYYMFFFFLKIQFITQIRFPFSDTNNSNIFGLIKRENTVMTFFG